MSKRSRACWHREGRWSYLENSPLERPPCSSPSPSRWSSPFFHRLPLPLLALFSLLDSLPFSPLRSSCFVAAFEPARLAMLRPCNSQMLLYILAAAAIIPSTSPEAARNHIAGLPNWRKGLQPPTYRHPIFPDEMPLCVYLASFVLRFLVYALRSWKNDEQRAWYFYRCSYAIAEICGNLYLYTCTYILILWFYIWFVYII